MKLYIKQKVFSLGDKFTVWDANGRERYFVQGEVFSWGKKLHVLNAQGEEVAFIQQEVLTFLPKFYVSVQGRSVATIRQEFTWLMPRYTVDGLGWDVEGQFLEHDYEITKAGRHIATITKEWMTWGDSYEMDIAPEADEVVALAVILAIDCIVAQRNTIKSGN